MTIIAAVSRDGIYAIAADTRVSFGSEGLYHDCEADSKIVTFPFGYAGFAGSTRQAQVVSEAWKGQSCAALDKVKLLKLCGLASEACRSAELDPSNDDNEKDFEAIIVDNNGVIWVIDSEFGFFRPGEFAAVGSGASFALGAMKVLCKTKAKSFNVRNVATVACEAAIDFCNSCGGEIIVHYEE